MASVSLSNVVKKFGTAQVIHGVSLDIEPGEFVILVGPSGCGKSTLLRMIAGLEEISGGEIEIAGTVVNEIEPKARDIAMVFQNYALYPHMTVAQNMGYSLKIAKIKPPERDVQVRAAAKILSLTELLDRYPRQLSGGQRQRVAMGRAIVRNPKVFLFDEPLSNLDAKLRVAMRGEIKTLHQKLQTTIVYVTHDQIEAMTMADKIVVMNQGRVEQIGSPLELFDRPANLFVASFIGSPAMNLFDGVFEVDAAGARLRLSDGQTWAADGIEGVVNGQDVIIGVRPEDFQVAPEGDGAISVEIVVVEPTGSETQVTVKYGEENLMLVFRDRVELSPGASLSIRSDAAKLHVFDKATGARISR